MLTHFALAVAPLLFPQEDSATLHTANADLFIDVPDVAALVEAWQETAIAAIAMDDELKGLFELAGISGPAALLGQLQGQELQQTLAILSNVKGLSLSVSLHDGAVDELVDEFRMLATSSQAVDLEFLHNTIEGEYLLSGKLPAGLDELGVGEHFLLDAHGNRFHYEPSTDGTFTLLALGADGSIGGVGANQDMGASVAMAPLLVSRLASLAGLEVVVEWHYPELVAPMLGMIVGRAQDEFPFLQASTLPVVDNGAESYFPPTAYRVDPAQLGAPAGALPVEFSLQMSGARTIATFGTIRGQDVTELLKKHLVGEVASSSLAADPSYLRSRTHTSGSEGVVVWRGFVNTSMGTSIGSGQSLAGLDSYNAIFDYMGVTAASGGWVTSLAEGLYTSVSCTSASPSQVDADASIANVAQWIPNEAVFVQAGTMDLHGLWELLLHVSQDSQQFTELLDGLDVNLQDDLVDNLGSEYAFWVSPVKGLSVPEVYLIVPVSDGEKLMTVLDKLCDKLVAVESDFSLSRRPYKGVNYTSLNVGIPIGVAPTFTVLDGNLWVSNSSILIKREIRRRSKGDDYERGNHPLFRRVVDENGSVPSNLRNAGYLDLGGVLSSYYNGARSLSGMLVGGMDLPPGFMDLLPSGELFTRHITPTFSETRLEDGVLITHKVGAFGPEPAAIVALGLYFSLMMGETIAGVVGPQAEGWENGGADRPRVREIVIRIDVPHAEFDTLIAFPIIEVGLLLYSIENADYPTELGALLRSSKAYPGGYIGESLIPTDGWGNPFHYQLLASGDYVLYSLGPNGKDDGGKGDDIQP